MTTFLLSDTNPNDAIGGGGCLCYPTKHVDCAGPYAIFPATETDSNISPHAVLSLTCVKGILKASKNKSQILSMGEEPPAEETL